MIAPTAQRGPTHLNPCRPSMNHTPWVGQMPTQVGLGGPSVKQAPQASTPWAPQAPSPASPGDTCPSNVTCNNSIQRDFWIALAHAWDPGDSLQAHKGIYCSRLNRDRDKDRPTPCRRTTRMSEPTNHLGIESREVDMQPTPPHRQHQTSTCSASHLTDKGAWGP